MADQSITGLEDAPDPLVGDWYLPIAQQGLRSRRILHTALMGATSWAGISGTPTTLVGYGITDAVPASAISAYGLTLVDDSNAAAARTTLELGNVDNTSDANKPVSSAQQTALNLKADTSSLGDLALLNTVGTTQIDNDAVTYAKIQNVSAATRLLGRGSAAGAGDVEELTVGAGLSLSGTALTATIAAANPTGTIGLSAVNGSAATFLRSDGAPALSQAIIPTWTGKHVFQAGILQNTGFYSDTFIGSGGAANMGHNQLLVTAQAATPEIGMQVALSGNVGTANKASAYKIAFTASMLGGANSANVYSINSIVQGHAGASGYLVTGIESDLNNIGAHANTLGGATAAYGFVSVAAGNFESTAAYWATAAPTAGRWTYGFATSDTLPNSIKEADFYSESTATRVVYALGTHTTGIDFLSATLTYAVAVKNNIPFVAYDSGSNVRNILKLNASDALEVGTAATALTLLGTITNFTWATYAPTFTSSSGTITTSTLNSARFMQVGQLVVVEIDVTITTVGTAAQNLTTQLPVTPSMSNAFAGHETAVAGFICGATAPAASTTLTIRKYDGTNIFASGNGSRFVISGSYEA